MRNWKVWAAFSAVFIAGITVGVVSVGLIIQHHFEKPTDRATFQATMQARLVDDIVDTVQPDESAIPAIREAVAETMEELDRIRTETQPRIRAVFEKARERIITHLTPEQISRFDQMHEDRKIGRFGFLRLPPPPPHLMPPPPLN